MVYTKRMVVKIMRYVIVCLIKGEALKFHEKLVEEICENFGVRPQRLPAHFTIKAPFEIEDVDEIINLTKSFCLKQNSAPMSIRGFGYFRKNVVYMKVNMSDEGKHIVDTYINELLKVPNLQWKANEKKEKVYHCTIVSKLEENIFDQIYAYVNKNICDFDSVFNNISILKWEKHRWVTFKEFKLS